MGYKTAFGISLTERQKCEIDGLVAGIEELRPNAHERLASYFHKLYSPDEDTILKLAESIKKARFTNNR